MNKRPTEQGGLGMIEICKKDLSIKCAWVKRLRSEDNANRKALTELFLPEAKEVWWRGKFKYYRCSKFAKK